MKRSAFPEVEEALMLLLEKVRVNNLPVSSPLLTKKAEIFGSHLKCKNFSCSNRWIARFKACHNVSVRVVCEEEAHADHKGAAE